MNLADFADAAVMQHNAPVRESNTDQEWEIVVQLGESEWYKIPFTGTACKAVELMEEYIDTIHDRWARGHNGMCVAASDGVAEKAWKKVFSTS